jgi:hypothetical protein
MRRVRTIVAICAVPVSVQCAKAQLPLFGGDLLPEAAVYERMRERIVIVISTRPEQFILFLGYNSLAYESWCFSVYYSLYYFNVYTYFPDESTV